MAAKQGILAKLYINTATGADYTTRNATPVWSPWQCVRSVDVNLSRENSDSTCRGAGRRLGTPTLMTFELSGEAIFEVDDPTFVVARDAFWNNTTVEVLALDEDRANATATGYRGPMAFTDFSISQPLDDVITVTFTLVETRELGFQVDQVTGPIT